jgi:hypothetical protein
MIRLSNCIMPFDGWLECFNNSRVFLLVMFALLLSSMIESGYSRKVVKSFLRHLSSVQFHRTLSLTNSYKEPLNSKKTESI